jgi:hypothetical protein
MGFFLSGRSGRVAPSNGKDYKELLDIRKQRFRFCGA